MKARFLLALSLVILGAPGVARQFEHEEADTEKAASLRAEAEEVAKVKPRVCELERSLELLGLTGDPTARMPMGTFRF